MPRRRSRRSRCAPSRAARWTGCSRRRGPVPARRRSAPRSTSSAGRSSACGRATGCGWPRAGCRPGARRRGLDARSARGRPAAARLFGLDRARPRRVRAVPASDRRGPRARFPRARRLGRWAVDVRAPRDRGHRGRPRLVRRARDHPRGPARDVDGWHRGHRGGGGPRRWDARCRGRGSDGAARRRRWRPARRSSGVVADSTAPELEIPVATRCAVRPGGSSRRRLFDGATRVLGADPRATEPSRVIGLLETVPLLLIHGEADTTVPIADGRRLAALAGPASEHWIVPGAEHSGSHAVAPAMTTSGGSRTSCALRSAAVAATMSVRRGPAL